MKIGMTYNLKSDWKFKDGDPVDANAEFDKPETINDVAAIFESLGHKVTKIGNVHDLLARINDLDVDIVFNIHEGIGSRDRESQVPVVLDLYGIPYTGSDGLTLGITLDKVAAKKCFIADGIPTPRYFVARNTNNLEKLNKIGYPLIVKTIWEGTSKGLTEKSRVQDLAGLKTQAEMIIKKYNQPALVEEFIKGTEFTVAVIGNENPKAMPIVQVSINGKTTLGNEFYTFSRTQTEEVRYVCPAKISDTLSKKIQEIAVAAYRSVGCRDYGRVDFRVDEDGNPYVLEINPLPSLDRKDVFNLFPKVLGSTFEDTIQQILSLSFKRCGLKETSSSKPRAVLAAGRRQALSTRP